MAQPSPSPKLPDTRPYPGPQPSSRTRLINRDGTHNILRVGLKVSLWQDVYHYFMSASWLRVIGVILGIFFSANAVFALAYTLDVGGIENARPGSYWDAFFFSVQTMATIGYGKMAPITGFAHALVTVEALSGLLGVALLTGLMFAKFSKPTARLLFSKYATIAPRDGRPSLIFRLANARGNLMVEAQMRLVLLRNEVTPEGENVRRVHDLALVRANNPVFTLSWVAIHPITEGSPLHGATPESLAAAGTEIVVSVVGIDGTSSQTVHARHAYGWDEIAWNMRFLDIFRVEEGGRRVLDFHRFDRLEAVPEDVLRKAGLRPEDVRPAPAYRE